MKFRLLAAIACTCFVAAGCTTFPRNTPGNTYGQISVGSPRIEGRERLVNDKLDQEQWLQKQLTVIRDAEYGIGGATALSNSSFLNAQANVNASPQYGLDALVRGRQTQALKSAAEDDRALTGFRTSARDEIISKFNKKEYTLKQATDELTALGYTVSPSTPLNQTSGTAPGAATAPKSTFLDKDAGARLDPPPDAPRRAQLSSSPLELFQDRLAGAEVVRNELNDVRLDDLHDLSGNTLYRLTFDTTVVPQDDTSAWAVVRVKAKLDLSAVDEAFLRRAAERYVRTLADANEATYRTMLNNVKTECWEQEIKFDAVRAAKWRAARTDPEEEAAFRRAFLCASRDVGSVTRRAFERQLAAWSSQNPATPLSDPTNGAENNRRNMQDLLLSRPEKTGTRDAKAALAAYEVRRDILRKWAVWLGEIFDRQAALEFEQSPIACYFGIRTDATRGGAFPYIVLPRTNPNERSPQCAGSGHTLADFQKNLEKHVKASVYASTPKELVQRLSEVSNNRKTTELLLGLSAVTGAAGVNAAIQSIKSNTALYEAIRRQPIVVGFTERGNVCSAPAANCADELVFGWMFGPSFTLSNDGKSAMFRHALAQRSVAASLSLPAWMEAIGLNVETSWHSESGERIRAESAPGSWSLLYQVHLPASPSQVFANLDRAPREPRVDRYQYLEVVEGSPASVLITGRDLWRSTQVFIGAQKATSLNVLPDYRGIAASFEKIAVPAGSAPSLNYSKSGYDLTVHTSEGVTLAGRVVINPPKEADGAERPVEIAGMPPRIVAGAEQTVTISKAQAVTDEPVVQITTPKDVSFLGLLADTTQLNQDRKTLVFALPAKMVPNLKSGDPVGIALAVKHGRSGGTEVFPISKAAVYYVQADDMKARVPASAKPTAPLKFNITLPAKASQAFSGLAGGEPALVAEAVDENGKTVPLQGTCKLTKDKDICAAQFETSGGWKVAVAQAKKLTLTVAFSGKDVPDFISDKIELKR